MAAREFRPTGARVHAGSARYGGLDGLRAIAVGMVLAYHLFPRALPGGFLGVDVFFVMSGFLITSLLLREREKTGRIDLLAFWRRRARRLLPAVALVVLVSTSLALAASRDLLVGVGQQIAGAVFFVSNWVFIANGSDYFARDAPELFRNFWSLALEEQFYIVLPLIAIVVFRLRSRATRAVLLGTLGIVSASLMAALAHGGANPTRVYFGSDTHSFGLFLGAALAVLLAGRPSRPLSSAGQVASLTVAGLGLAGLGALAWVLPEASPESFLGGFQLATIASLAVVWAITREGAIAGRILDAAPLRWVGERSYGIYLWHWPLLVIMTSLAREWGTEKTWVPQIVTLTLTVAFAAVSYRCVEQPVRRVGLRGSLVRWFSPSRYTPRRRRVALGLAGVVAVTFPLTGVAIAIAPERTSSAEVILRGKEQLEQDRAAGEAPHGSPAAPPGESSTEPRSPDDGAAVPGTAGEHPQNSPSAPAAPAPTGADMTAVGDSVMLASYPELTAAFPGIEVDAAVSRGAWAGVDIVTDMAQQGTLRQIVVVGLGTNGPVDEDALAALRQAVGERQLILVDAHGERDWIPEVNDALAAFADAHRGVTVAPWDSQVEPTPEYLAEDGIHPGPEGGRVYAAAIQQALDDLFAPGEAAGWGVPRR